MTTYRVARRVPWYPTSREKRARCGAPDRLLPVQEAGHLMFQLATASRLRGMTKERSTVPWRVVAGIPGLKIETWGTLRYSLGFYPSLGLLLLVRRWLCSVRDTVRAAPVPFPLARLGRSVRRRFWCGRGG
jgi:hypothetical protein